MSTLQLHRNKLAACTTAAALLLVLAACGGGGGDSGSGTTPAPPPPPPPPPPTALEIATTALATTADFFKNPLPNTGEARYSGRNDACYLGDGRTLPWLIADYNADVTLAKAAQAFRVGSTFGNIKVLADRSTTNSDGSARREIDIEFDTTLVDGTKVEGSTETLIFGSSFGACATPDARNEWRFFGNRKLVGVGLQARNYTEERYLLASGAAASPARFWRRDIRFVVTDPVGNADYVVVTGPGPTAAGGKPFSVKLLSPKISRDAPEMQGKTGNSNWRDVDSFRWCNLAPGITTVPDAEVVDCVANGVSGDNWGFGIFDRAAATLANGDTGFAGQGWVAGGVYTFKVYKDDGWKTVNGHAGKTPIATYTATLKALPYTFVEMDAAIAGSTDSRYGGFTSSTQTPVQVADALKNAGVNSATTWAKATLPASGGKPMALSNLYVFGQGAKVGNAAGAAFPRIRQLSLIYPGATATSGNVFFDGKPATMQTKTYSETAIEYTDRNGNWIRSLVVFQ